MQEPPPVDTLLSALQSFADDVASALSRPQLDWAARRHKGEWSLTEVVCHLRDVEREVHQPRIKALVREENAFLPGAVADDWVMERQYHKEDGRAALAAFLAAREETLSLLSSLADPLWQRQGQHAFFGPTTMHELVTLMAQHDDAHWEQISDLLGQ